MYGNQGAQRYRETDLGTMTRERMVVLLYEKMVSDLEDAIIALEKADRATFTRKVNHSQRIVAELRNSLDHATGGEIARNLDSIYEFVFREHLSLLLDRNPARARACIDVLAPLLAAWRQIPNGTAENALRERARTATGGSDPASVRGTAEAAPAAPTAAGAPDPGSARPSLLSVSA